MTTRSLAIFCLAAALALAPLFGQAVHQAALLRASGSLHQQDQAIPERSARALLIGSGLDARSTEKQIEDDIALAQQLFGGERFGGSALTLFAAGPDRPSVRVSEPLDDFDERSLLSWLFGGDLLAGHRINAPDIHVDYAATREGIEAIFAADADSPKLEIIYFAGHGERRDRVEQSFFTLSGGERMSVAELSALLDQSPGRERLFIHSACYSGAFAELIFNGADAELGLSDPIRCGLFASSADDPATGCSAEGDREAHEGFALHFLNALQGLARDGTSPLDADLDGDGELSALEAHAIARAHAEAIDVPTTSSERALRYLIERRAPFEREIRQETKGEELSGASADDASADPIERYVIQALEASLKLSSEEDAARALDRVSDELKALESVIDEAKDELNREASRIEARILALSPYLSDAWDARFEPALARHGRAIEALFNSEASDGLHASIELVELLRAEYEPKLIERAKLRRLLRAHENLRLLARLGERERERYETIRRCESRPLFSQTKAP